MTENQKKLEEILNKKREPIDINTPDGVKKFLQWLFDPEVDEELRILMEEGGPE